MLTADLNRTQCNGEEETICQSAFAEGPPSQNENENKMKKSQQYYKLIITKGLE